jgi:hypothetical protein
MKNRITDVQPASWGKQAANVVRAARESDPRDWLAATEKLVKENPGAALVAAFSFGAAIAWLLKRR